MKVRPVEIDLEHLFKKYPGFKSVWLAAKKRQAWEEKNPNWNKPKLIFKRWSIILSHEPRYDHKIGMEMTFPYSVLHPIHTLRWIIKILMFKGYER